MGEELGAGVEEKELVIDFMEEMGVRGKYRDTPVPESGDDDLRDASEGTSGGRMTTVAGRVEEVGGGGDAGDQGRDSIAPRPAQRLLHVHEHAHGEHGSEAQRHKPPIRKRFLALGFYGIRVVELISCKCTHA